jgi:hypothetical protein
VNLSHSVRPRNTTGIASKILTMRILEVVLDSLIGYGIGIGLSFVAVKLGTGSVCYINFSCSQIVIHNSFVKVHLNSARTRVIVIELSFTFI